MVSLNLKNEILKSTSFDDFKKRIRGSIFSEGQHKNNPIFSFKTWMKGLELLREAHKMNLVYEAFEQCTNDKEKLNTCMEIVDGLENLCSLNDENRIEHINEIQKSIWNNVTNLNLSRQVMAVMDKNAGGQNIQYTVRERDSSKNNPLTEEEKGSGNILIFDVVTAKDTFFVEIHLNVAINEGINHASIDQHKLIVVSNLHLKDNNNTVSLELRNFYSDYMNQFPLDIHRDINRKINDFSSVVKTALASEICSLYMANEDELKDEDKNRMVELLFAIAIAFRFGQY